MNIHDVVFQTKLLLLPSDNACWDINRFRSLRHTRKTEQHALVFLQTKNTFRSFILYLQKFCLICIINK